MAGNESRLQPLSSSGCQQKGPSRRLTMMTKPINITKQKFNYYISFSASGNEVSFFNIKTSRITLPIIGSAGIIN